MPQKDTIAAQDKTIDGLLSVQLGGSCDPAVRNKGLKLATWEAVSGGMIDLKQ